MKTHLFALILIGLLHCYVIQSDAGTPARWYKFENLSGNTIVEENNAVNNGTIVGTVTPVPGVGVGNAINFLSGNNAYANLGNTDILRKTNFTVEMWIKPTASMSRGTILGQQSTRNNDVTGTWGLYYREGGLLSFSFNRGLGSEGAFDLGTVGYLPLNSWTHIALVRDGGVYKIYVNGTVYCAQKDKNGTSPTSTVTLGALLNASNNPVECFTGAIDEVKLYDSSLTDEQIIECAGLQAPTKMNVSVTNGTISGQFVYPQTITPVAKDFRAYIKVNNDISKGLELKNFNYNAGESKVTFSFDALPVAAVQQNAKIELFYKSLPFVTVLTVVPGSVSAPSVSNLTIKGKLETREILSADYSYNDPASHVEYESTYEWYMSESPSGNYTKIQGVNTQTLMLLKAQNGKYIKVKVTPKNDKYAQGTLVESAPVGPVVVQQYNPRTDWFKEAKYGISCHFLPNYLNWPGVNFPENEKFHEGETIDQFLATFDVQKFAQQVNEAGAKFVILTIDQHSGLNITPNSWYDKIIGAKPGEKSSVRDLPMEIADELAKYDIKLLLYFMGVLPAKASMDYTDGEGSVSGTPMHSSDRWGDLLLTRSMDVYPFSDIFTQDNLRKFEKIISEWGDHYRDKVAGFWFDGMYRGNYYDNMNNYYNINTVIHAARKGNPDRIVSAAGLGDKEHMDFWHGEVEDIITLPSSRWESGNTYHQWFRWNPLGNHNINAGWGIPVDPNGRIFDTNDLAQWARRATNIGGTACFDIRLNRFGELDVNGMAQLKAVKEAIAKNAISADICGNINLPAVDAVVEGGPFIENKNDNIGNWWNNGSASWNFNVENPQEMDLFIQTSAGWGPMQVTMTITGPNSFSKVINSEFPSTGAFEKYEEVSYGKINFTEQGLYTLKIQKTGGNPANLRYAKLIGDENSQLTGSLLIDNFEGEAKFWDKVGSFTLEVVENPTGKADCLNESPKVIKFERGNAEVEYSGIILRGQSLNIGSASGCNYRYAHIMMKKSTRGKVGLKVEGNGNYETNVAYPNTDDWTDVVVDMAAAGNKTFPAIFIQPDKIANSAATVYIDNVLLSNNPNPRTCSDTGIKDVDVEKLSVYPNPASDFIYITGSEKKIQVSVFDSVGRLVLKTNDVPVNVTNLDRGIYFLKVKNETTKIIIK